MSIVQMRKTMHGWVKWVMMGIALVFVIGVFVGMGSGRNSDESQEAKGGVIAKINGEKLSRQDFENRYEKKLIETGRQSQMTDRETSPSQIENTLGPLQAEQIRGQVFDQATQWVLMVQAADKEGVRVSRGELKRKINEIVDQTVKQQRDMVLAGRKVKDPDKVFNAELKKMGMSQSKLEKDIRDSIDRDMLRQQMMIDELNDKLKKSVNVSDRALRESFDEFRLSQITVGTQKRSDAQAKVRAEEVINKLKGGADFATLAKQASDDQYKDKGGDWGFAMPRPYIQPDFRDVVTKLKPGEISDPIKTPMGYAILKVTDKKNNLPKDFSDPKKQKQYRDNYMAQEQSKVQTEFMEKVQKSAKIEVLDSELKAYKMLTDLSKDITSASPAKRKEMVLAVIAEFQRAALNSQSQPAIISRASAQMGMLYNALAMSDMFNSTKEEKAKYQNEAISSLQNALEYTDHKDLRMIIADLLIKEKQYDKAAEHLEYASDQAYDDPQIHQAIQQKIGQMKGYDPAKLASLAKKESDWLKEYERMMKERQAAMQMQAPNAPAAPAKR